MADKGFVNSLLNRLDSVMRQTLGQAFDYVLDNLRFGQPENQERAQNFQGYFFSVTTSSVAGQEFSFIHQLGITPYLLIPVLALGDVTSQIVPLQVARAADAQRVYLASSSTGVPVVVYVEA